MRKTMLVLTVSMLLLMFSACSQKINDSADIKAIQTSVQDFLKAYNAKDADALSSLMTDDVAFAVANYPEVVGKDGAQKLAGQIFAQYDQSDIELSATAADVQVRGDLGVARGAYALKITHKTGLLAAVNSSGNWTAVYKRQGDGSWKLASDMSNSDQPMAGATAAGADEKALIQIEQDLAAAMTKGDTASIDRFVAKEWVFRTAEGQLRNKAQFLAELKTALKFSSFILKNLSPHVFGDFAIVTMIGEVKGTYQGKAFSSSERGVDFFFRRDGRWQAVYSQNTTAKP